MLDLFRWAGGAFVLVALIAVVVIVGVVLWWNRKID